MHRLLFELTRLNSVDLRAPLIPLERVQSLRQVGTKAVLDVVVNTHVAVDQVVKVVHNIVCVFVEQPLQLGHLLVVVKVFFVLCVKLVENLVIVLQSLD